ncbi:hypothetical protein QBC38DRAFT_462264 [Podospora fimiseda]|uniref:Uncharacterized protein n=1 Tax=Podospora fimiseda TaxID=252190 RepID=A0AAN6YMY8_9PEZI|nr:hypothetical protein QBC38DRAFT_462264 [Podospora fimiseda]
MIDHQADYERRDGVSIMPRLPAKRYLHCWEFRDIARSRGPLLPHVCELEIAGKGWVDLVRAIRAVTIFGNGFGALIQPVDAGGPSMTGMTNSTTSESSGAQPVTPGPSLPVRTQPTQLHCPEWTEVPTGKYYLATRIMDLQEIIDHDNQTFSSLLKLSIDLLWPIKSEAFSSCPCMSANPNRRGHCDPVQTLFRPSRQSKSPEPETKVVVQSAGAVIFGHTTSVNPIRYLLPGSSNQSESAVSADPSTSKSSTNDPSMSSTPGTQNTLSSGFSNSSTGTESISLTAAATASASLTKSNISTPSTLSTVPNNLSESTVGGAQSSRRGHRLRSMFKRLLP